MATKNQIAQAAFAKAKKSGVKSKPITGPRG